MGAVTDHEFDEPFYGPLSEDVTRLCEAFDEVVEAVLAAERGMDA